MTTRQTFSILSILLVSVSTWASAPSKFTIYGCRQLCGLTSSTGTWVSATAISQWAAKSAMSTFCSNLGNGMKLQGEANCSGTDYDYSGHEAFQRCKQRVAGARCFVNVYGYNLKSTLETFYRGYAASFDDAEALAVQSCRNDLGYGATCNMGDYTAE